MARDQVALLSLVLLLLGAALTPVPHTLSFERLPVAYSSLPAGSVAAHPVMRSFAADGPPTVVETRLTSRVVCAEAGMARLQSRATVNPGMMRRRIISPRLKVVDGGRIASECDGYNALDHLPRSADGYAKGRYLGLGSVQIPSLILVGGLIGIRRCLQEECTSKAVLQCGHLHWLYGRLRVSSSPRPSEGGWPHFG